MDESRRRWLRWAVAGLGVGAVLGLVLWAFVSAGDSNDPLASPGAAPESTPSDSSGTPAPSATPGPPPASPDEPDPIEPAVGFDETSPPGTQVRVRIVSLESVAGEALGPGEVAGPAVRVTIELTNDTDAQIPLSSTAVNAFAGPELAPAEGLSGSGARWFEGSIAPRDVATGVYVFAVPADRRDLLQITVSYSPTAPTVLFEGAAPPA